MNDFHVMDICHAINTTGWIIAVGIFGAGIAVAVALVVTHGVA